MIRSKAHLSLLGVSIGAAMLLVATSAAQAELRHVEQTIFGMDCAPCAVGVERRLSRMEGITQVQLSLNEGKATVELAPGNEVALHEIRDAIRRNAFNPREAQVQVNGTLQRHDEVPVLISSGGERFALRTAEGEQAEQAWQELSRLDEGERVAVMGQVPAHDPRQRLQWLALHVETISRLEESDTDAAAAETSQMQAIGIAVKGMACEMCSGRLETALNQAEGVAEAGVDLAAGQARIRYDARMLDLPALEALIRQSGFEPEIED